MRGAQDGCPHHLTLITQNNFNDSELGGRNDQLRGEQGHCSTLQRFNEQFIQGGDVNTFWSTIDRNFVNRSAQPGMSTGPDGALFWFNNVLRPAFPDLTVIINDQVAEGDLVVTRKSYQGTHQAVFMGVEATGRAVSFEVIDILRLRGGKYVEHWANADMFGLMNQLTR